jgi:hypothetical protein
LFLRGDSLSCGQAQNLMRRTTGYFQGKNELPQISTIYGIPKTANRSGRFGSTLEFKDFSLSCQEYCPTPKGKIDK